MGIEEILYRLESLTEQTLSEINLLREFVSDCQLLGIVENDSDKLILEELF